MHLVPTHLFSSPLRRARETAEILQSLLPSKPKIQIRNELTPEMAPGAVLALLDTLPSDAVVWCIGHEPHLSTTAGILLAGKSCASLGLKKAGACLIHLGDTVRPTTGRLEWWLTAAQLRALA